MHVTEVQFNLLLIDVSGSNLAWRVMEFTKGRVARLGDEMTGEWRKDQLRFKILTCGLVRKQSRGSVRDRLTLA